MADYLEDDEVVDRIRAWWRENGTSLVASLLLVVGGWAGWNWYGTYSEEQASESFVQFADYVALREDGEGDSEEASEVLARLDEDYRGSGGHVLSLLYRAGDAVRSEDMALAIQHLEAALAASPDGQVEALVRLRLARVYLQEEAFDAALNILQGIEAEEHVAAREELRGDVFLAKGQGQEARSAYQAAIEAQDADDTGASWPFTSMKRYGLSFEDADEDAQDEEDAENAENVNVEPLTAAPALEQAGEAE